MVLMFIQFLSDRLETQVLSSVDTIVGEEMTGRFQDLGGGNDPHLALLQRMTETMVKATETLVEKQAVVWRKSLESSEKQWSTSLQAAGQELQTSLAAALEQSLRVHAETLLKVEQATATTHAARWEKWTAALLESAQALHAQQAELAKQGSHLAQAVKATGDVIQLEQALNANLSALAGSKNFEETAVSLAAAVNLLSTRMGRADSPRVDLQESKTKGRAA